MNTYEPLVQKRCQGHPNREAVARCPECFQFFCRECVTEHDDRVLCTTCLKKILSQRSVSLDRFKAPLILLQFLGGFFILWLMFYYTGKCLLWIPSSFHEGTFWEEKE